MNSLQVYILYFGKVCDMVDTVLGTKRISDMKEIDDYRTISNIRI